MRSEILDLIYPSRCPICQEILAPKDGLIHTKCRNQLVFVQEPSCMRCGKPLEISEQEYCYDCSKRNFHYKKGFPCIKYDKKMSKSIAAFKYHGKTEFAKFYVTELCNRYEDIFRSLHFDVLIPIPIHKSKYHERGFNQAEILAEGISKRINVPVDVNSLIRNRKTLPQKELNDKERLKNLELAFELNRSNLNKNYHRVLLVDDIYTTGSTIEACARILDYAGVDEIFYTSVCIGQGF